MEKKFREKIANINSLLEQITPYEKERVEKVKERITDALEKTLSVDYDKNRLEQELIYYIEKLLMLAIFSRNFFSNAAPSCLRKSTK